MSPGNSGTGQVLFSQKHQGMDFQPGRRTDTGQVCIRQQPVSMQILNHGRQAQTVLP